VRKFLQFQLTINVVAVVSVFICSIFLEQSIMTPVQMLWVNLIMDTFAALALATEPPHEKLLERHPHKRTDYIISGKMGKHIVLQSIFQIIVVLSVTFWGQTFVYEDLKDPCTGPRFPLLTLPSGDGQVSLIRRDQVPSSLPLDSLD